MSDRPQIVTAANALTLMRVPLAALVWLAPHSRAWLLAILAIAAISDLLDGRIARRLRARDLRRGRDPAEVAAAHRVGTWLDPVCDKLFVLSVVAMVAYAYRPPAGELVLIATRELILVPAIAIMWPRRSAAQRARVDFRAGRIGKLTTAAQFAAIGAIVFWPRAAAELALLAAIFGLAASIYYISRAAREAGAGRTAQSLR